MYTNDLFGPLEGAIASLGDVLAAPERGPPPSRGGPPPSRGGPLEPAQSGGSGGVGAPPAAQPMGFSSPTSSPVASQRLQQQLAINQQRRVQRMQVRGAFRFWGLGFVFRVGTIRVWDFRAWRSMV